MLTPAEIFVNYLCDSSDDVVRDHLEVPSQLLVAMLNLFLEINERVSVLIEEELGPGSPLHVGEHILLGDPMDELAVVLLDE